tara:strand:+ start:340 stop:1044 length:705 start_codon:yes stop_codon:yes gene_type:complete
MCYVTSEMSRDAINRMTDFYENLASLYEGYGIKILDDTCRRNSLMSHAQEKFFSEEIKNKYPNAYCDGRTGQADIVIPEIKKELECKLTTRRAKGGYSLQADYGTLKRKGSCDFLYVLTDRDFSSFSVLFFNNLTIDDFSIPSPGSRGKSKMNKAKAMKKCTVLMGSVSTQNEFQINKIKEEIKNEKKDPVKFNRRKRKVQKLFERLEHWKNAPDRFLINLEKTSGREEKTYSR